TSSSIPPTDNRSATVAMTAEYTPGPLPLDAGQFIMPGMRIHSIEAIAIDIPLARNFGGSTYAVRKRSTVITRLRTEGGLVSEVYNGDNREHGPEIVRLIHDELAPRLRGLGILEGERIWERMVPLSHTSRDRQTLVEANACVDCADWELVGKARGGTAWAL